MGNILITGSNGFVGTHTIAEFSSHGYDVWGVGGPLKSGQNPLLSKYSVLDLTIPANSQKIDFNNVASVVHLAGLAAVGPSFDNPMDYVTTNMGIEVNLYEAALAQNAFPRFLIVSSGSLYDPRTPLPITEKSELNPSSPYAVSKLGQEQMARYYQARGFETIIARPFNHCGPGQAPGFIVPDLAQQLIAVERGEKATVSVGNLDAERDYTDVRDIARAYRLLIEKGIAGEIYNICSGTPRSGHAILDGLQAASGIEANTVQDPTKMRPADNPIIYGDYAKINEHTGWSPEITFETTMTDVIADWRSR